MDATALLQGLVITVIGMALVFGALGLFWALITLLGRAFPAGTADTGAVGAAPQGVAAPDTAEAAAGSSPTAERARVAAMVAGALLAGALPLHMEPPAGPAFEHGRTAPSWVTSNRARALLSWQPPRRPEA